MSLSLPWGFYYHEYTALAHLAASMAFCALFGCLLLTIGHRASMQVRQRDAVAMIVIGWAMVAGLGALPFVIDGLLSPVDAYFESMSGFTTTGSSVMPELDSAPRCIVFWRCFTHWLGGLGIVLMLVAILPNLGIGGKRLFYRESTGPAPRGMHPRIKDTAVALYLIYIGLTLLGIIGLMCVGMNLYEASCHCFAALATGGFSTRYSSVASFNSLPIEIMLIVIMLVGGTNFGLFYQMIRGQFFALFKDEEFRIYILFFVAASLLITFNLMGAEYTIPVVKQAEEIGGKLVAEGVPPTGLPLPRVHYPFSHALRVSSFQVSTLMTDCGFVTDNTDVWPYFARVLLLIITITGGCVGSTAGGLKISRVILMTKMAANGIERVFRPQAVRAVSVNGETVTDDVMHRCFVFFVLYVAWLTFAWLFMSAMGLPMDSALSAVIATMNNCGPGFEFVGGTVDYSSISDLGTVFLSLNMLVGRLEVVTVLALFMPGFWRRE